MTSKAARAATQARQRDADRLLATLRLGQQVDVTDAGGSTLRMSVSRELHRSDGRFGSWESGRVTVTLGPGRYSCEVTIDQLADTLGWGRPVTLVPVADDST